MNKGDIFLLPEMADLSKDRHGNRRLFLCTGAHERVKDAYYVNSVLLRADGSIKLKHEGTPHIVTDAMIVREAEVIE